MKRSLRESLHAAMFAEAAAWIMGVLFVFFMVNWHDVSVMPFWDNQYASGSLFLTQHQYQRVPLPATEPAGSYALWLSIIRYEGDVSVGVLAASASVVLVTAVRRWKDRQCWSGPGAVACSTALAAMGLCVLEEVSEAAKRGRELWGRGTNPFPNVWPHFELRIALAVLGAWVVLIGAGLWRPPGSWADRIGVVVGILWLCLIVYRITACLVIPFGNWGY